MGEKSASSFDLEKAWQDIVIGIPEELETTFRPEQCIYRAPPAIRKLNEAAYTPQVISIGPFHHGRKNLKPMEIQKKRYLKEFCKRLRGQPKEQVPHESLKQLLSIIKGRGDDIKRCYAATYPNIKTENQFVNMILLDAVFIFELFLKTKEYSVHHTMYKDDFIIGKPWLRAAIQRDLILLENQLPFFFLEELYDHATSTSTSYCKATYPPFLDLSCHYFENYGKNKTLPVKTKHFTDLVRYFLSFNHPKLESPGGKQIKNLYSATMLHQAGIKFKELPDECLLDIRAWNVNEKSEIKKGELHMPQLEIDNCTECLFRNLMALEQCHYPGEEFICRYVKLLDFLVDVKKDVDLLIENKIIVSRLGDSKSVASLINTLCLVSVYFKNVWIGTGTVIGLIILAITVTRFILFFFRR